MLSLAPPAAVRHACPRCGVALGSIGSYIPGMRCLAEMECPPCHRRFYGDLPSGHGLYFPALLDPATGEVFGPREGSWFAAWLRDSFARRSATPIPFEAEGRTDLRDVVLLNCLDVLYGHCVLKLLNAQYYLDRHPDLDLVVLVPRFLRWMVPSGPAAIWTLDLPLRRGAEWNDWLAAEIARRLAGARTARLSLALSHPHPQDFDIQRFTGVAPFPADGWSAPVERPVVTFLLRDDRPWGGDPTDRANRGARRKLRSAGRRLRLAPAPPERQRRNVLRFADALRALWPAIDLAVAGVGTPGGFPAWTEDLRAPSFGPDDERALCRRYARSHLVVGVHGSGMLLPSAHAGASLEIAWGPNLENAVQDLLVRDEDPRLALFRHRLVPPETTPERFAGIADSILRFGQHAVHLLSRRWTDHEALSRDPNALAGRLATARDP